MKNELIWTSPPAITLGQWGELEVIARFPKELSGLQTLLSWVKKNLTEQERTP